MAALAYYALGSLDPAVIVDRRLMRTSLGVLHQFIMRAVGTRTEMTQPGLNVDEFLARDPMGESS
jgi:hypothetical protein